MSNQVMDFYNNDSIRPFEMSFGQNGKTVGTMRFNGDVMTFEGEADAAAAVFIDMIVKKQSQQWVDAQEKIHTSEFAFNQFFQKTDWVQGDNRFDVIIPWGKHRADVLREYIDHVEAKCAALAAELKQSQIDAGCYKHGMEASNARLVRVVAENAALKDGVTYFAYSPEYGFDYFANKQAAIDTAQEEIDAYREDADDGWSEDVQRVSWGIVMQQAQGFDARGIHTSDNQHTYQTCDYRLVDAVQTPATEAFLAEVRAQGVEMFASSLKVVGEHEHPYSVVAKEFAAQLRQEAAQ